MPDSIHEPDILPLDHDDVQERLFRSRTEGGEQNDLPPEGVCWLGGEGYRSGARVMKDGAQVVCVAGRWETVAPEGGGGAFPFPPAIFDNEAQP